MIANSATSMFVTAQDGLKLHVRRHMRLALGPRIAAALPVVCLPGLARTRPTSRHWQPRWRTIRIRRDA